MRTKKLLRQHFLQQRGMLDMPSQHAMLAQMVDNFQLIPFEAGKWLLSYIPIEKKREVPASFFEETLRAIHATFGICYPSANFESGKMQAFQDNDNLVLDEVDFGLIQPTKGDLVSPTDIDVILVPLLSFDKKGHRLGYGKGFYDRFFSQCKPGVLKIGLSWFAPLEEIPEINPQDVPLSYCVTPQALYVF